MQEALLSTIFDSESIGIAITDLQGRFIRTNPAYQELTGFSDIELAATTCESLTHPDDLPHYQALLKELVTGQRETFVLVHRYHSRGGAAIWVRSRISMLRGHKVEPYLISRVEDITERRQLQALLDERTKPFHLLVASITDYAIFILSPEGRVASWNPGAERIKGYMATEIIGQHCSRLYSREDVEHGKPARDLQTAVAQGRFEDEGWRLRKDGTMFWGNVVITPMWKATGELRGYARITRDLTARRQFEARLRESETRLRSLLQYSPSVIFMKDLEGRYLYTNARFQQRIGLTGEDIIGSTDAELFLPGQAAAYSANDHAVLAHGTPLEFEETAQYNDGLCISRVSKFPVRNDVGSITAIGGIATDISEHKRALEALHDSERSFRELVDKLPIAVYVCDSSGLVENYNRRALELWGRKPCQGENLQPFCGACRIYSPEGKPLTHPDCPMGEALVTSQAVIDRELIIERPDGSRRTTIVNVIPRRDEHGKQTGVINCLMDISERKQAESELKEYAEQLRVLSSRLVELHEEGRLALSRELHDRVGQNLTALNINLGILFSQLPDRVKPDILPRLQDSQELIRATVDVINDVMAELRPPLLDDYGLLPALKSIADQFAQRTGINVTVRGPAHLERLPRPVEISLCRITQEALTNLAKHAQARQVKLEVALPPGRITLTIADDGIGFDPAAPPQQPGRTGWGMLTMRERAVALGGNLMIESTPGLGTQVTVTLTR
jgi:PAS domain S-box-containing protein